MDHSEILRLIAKAKGASFASFTYTATSKRIRPETSRYTVGLNFDLKRIYKEDLATLKAKRETLSGVDLEACDELINSISESLSKGIGNNSAYTRAGTVHSTPIKGVRLVEAKDGSTHFEILCNVLQTKILKKGEYKPVNSRPKTIAKRKLEKGLKRSKIRTFKLSPDTFKTIKANGETLEIC